MKKLLSILLAMLLVLMTLIPCFASADSVMYVKTGNGKNLNVREKPNYGAEVMYTLKYGTKVRVLTGSSPMGSRWVFVEPVGYSNGGYVVASFLTDVKPGAYVNPVEDPNTFKTVDEPYAVTVNKLKKGTTKSIGLRAKAYKNSKLLRRLKAGDVLIVLATGDSWAIVQDQKSGLVGYAHMDYVTFDHAVDPETLSEEVLQSVEEMIGSAD